MFLEIHANNAFIRKGRMKKDDGCIKWQLIS